MSRTPPGLLYAGGVAAVAATVLGVVAISVTRTSETRAEAARREAEIKTGKRALVVAARRGPAERRIELQGEARPFASVTLYAKVSGYLRDLKVDRGDRVRAGQVLAVIQSPELDRQYDAARADADFKRANAKRAAALAGPGAVSVREAELERTSAQVADAQVAAMATQRGYTILRAPFAGTVTARYADLGALVQNAANAQSGALPVLTVSQLDRLRVFLYVDQRDAPLVHVGDPAEIAVPDGPVRIGRVSRASGELDPHSRTMLVEIHLDNKDAHIIAGSFVTARLVLKTAPLVEVPVEALLMREQKPFVAVVQGGRVALRDVTVAHHDGARVALAKGVQDGELVALNLGRQVADGDLIQPVTSPPAAAPNAGARK